MHNGYIPEFWKLKRDIIAMLSDEVFHEIKGSTDSEYFFLLFLEFYKNSSTQDKLTKISECLEQGIKTIWDLLEKHHITDQYMLNVIISDGVRVVWSRFHSLWAQWLNTLYYKDAPDATIIASEPLDHSDDLKEVKEDSIITVDENNDVINKELSL